ncbi:pectinesterase family protein [Paenibacillus dauci]|uniref:pectinesterase family protein n=1 Tax=Paenibacillus dauci TaxID=1567106 RepID=UPI0006198780|nr:pectinesterase family protein [Paenibacillus dauci]
MKLKLWQPSARPAGKRSYWNTSMILVCTCAVGLSLLPVQSTQAQDQPATSSLVAEASQTKTITVAQDGSGQYSKVQSAIDSIASGNKSPVTIYVKNGTYREKITFPKDKPYITLTGESATGTILTYSDTSASAGGTTNSSSTFVMSDHFTAQNITFANTAGKDAGQAVALYVRGDRAIFKNVRMLGHQDTLYTPGSGRQYYENCYIEGTVDFVFGSATAVFNNCELKSLGNGYITAASTPVEQPYGYVFLNSKLTRSSAVGNASVHLGRPWRPYSSVTYINTTMDSHIRPEGWNNWGNAANEQTARYSEYNSKGPGAVGTRVGWSKLLSSSEAAAITISSVLAGNDGWNPAK